MRGHGRGRHARRLSDRALQRRRRPVVRPLRSGRRGVLHLVGISVVARTCGGGTGSRDRARATGHYLRSRVVRIMPAYLVAVVVILTLLPDSDHASPTVWLANLTLTQIYVPLTLTGGLTQMWSLSVEVSFYLALPVLALLARRMPVGARVPVIAALGGAQLGVGLGAAGACRSRDQPAELAAGVLLLVRRGHVAGRVGPQPDRLAASTGAPPGADGRRSRWWPIWWRPRRWPVRRGWFPAPPPSSR